LYVSDDLLVPLRTGPSVRHAITRNLPSGTAVEVLERTPDEEYARIKVLDDRGSEGWALNQYLTAQPIAEDRLETSERSLAAARDRLTELETQLALATAELESTRSRVGELDAAHVNLSSELATVRAVAADPISISQQNESLRRQLLEREQEVARLSTANAELERRTRQNWFIIGAMVLLAGVVLGLVLPGLKRRRRSSW
jgi:SH3 domain protein